MQRVGAASIHSDKINMFVYMGRRAGVDSADDLVITPAGGRSYLLPGSLVLWPGPQCLVTEVPVYEQLA